MRDMIKRLLWFLLTLGLSVAVTLAFMILPLAANGFEGTGASEKEWAFWVPWVLVHALAGCLAACRRRWEVVAALCWFPVSLMMSLHFGWPWAPAR